MCSLSVGLLSTACMEDLSKDAAPRLTISAMKIEMVRTGVNQEGSIPTFSVTANKGFTITSDSEEWLSVNIPKGPSGITTVKALATENTTDAPRHGILTVTSNNLTEKIYVTQTTAEDLADRDDGRPVGYEYLWEDFSWILTLQEQLGTQWSDRVVDPSTDSSRGVYSNDHMFVDQLAQENFTAHGLTYGEWFSNGARIFMARHYLKLNTGASLNIQLSAFFQIGTSSKIRLTFKAAPYLDKNGVKGSNTGDCYIKYKGRGSVSPAGSSDKESPTFAISVLPVGEWMECTVDIEGANAEGVITILSPQAEKRLFIDDIRIVKISE